MKICFLGDSVAYHLLRWAKYFSDKGHDVSAITLNSQIIDDFGRVKVYLLKKTIPGSNLISRTLNLVPTLTQLKKLIKKINPDVLHAHSVSPYAYLGALTNFHPFIVTPWGNDVLIDIKKSKIERVFTKLSLKKADLITCDGENTKEVIIKLGISSQKIKFIIFGVDIEKFKPNLEKEKLKRSLFQTNSKIVISSRILTPVHNVGTFVKSAPLVLKVLPDIKFLVVGDGPEKNHLINTAKSLGVFNSIEFFGKAKQEEMISLLQASDAYVSTSLSESGLAASTAEAMACELPVINTDTGDIRLWIEDGKGGFVIPIKDPKILAEKIIYLLKNDKERSEFGRINRKIIEERNNYYKEMAKMENIYRELINIYAR